MKDFKPGNYDLILIELINYKGESLDIAGLFVSLDIYEDIFSASMSAELFILDAIDLFKNFPIIGEEKLKIVFRTRENFNQIELEFYSYLTVDVLKFNDSAKIFLMSLTTKERMIDLTTNLNRSIKLPHCAAVNSILKNELKTSKQIFTDSCLGEMNYTPAMHRPFEAIMLITSRAKSKETVNPVHVFFESNKGFNFKTLEKLVVLEGPTYTVRPKLFAGQEEEGKFFSVNAFTKIKSISTIEKFNNGGVNSTYIKFDPITRTVSTSKKSLFDEQFYSSFLKIGSPNQDSKVYSKDFEFKEGDGLYKLVLDSDRGSISQERLFLLNNYTNSFVWNIDVPGNSNLAVGQVLVLDVPELIQTTEETSEIEAGKFLITALRHKLSPSKYSCSMEISKDSYSANPTKNADITKLKPENN